MYSVYFVVVSNCPYDSFGYFSIMNLVLVYQLNNHPIYHGLELLCFVWKWYLFLGSLSLNLQVLYIFLTIHLH